MLHPSQSSERLDEFVEGKRPFGYGLYVDLYDCNPQVMDDLQLCYQFLDELVDRLGMTKQAPPFLFRSPDEYPDKAGLSGWVPLIESGAQIHTLTATNFVSIDVYSCGYFDQDIIIKFAEIFFSPESIEVNALYRGVDYHEKHGE